MLIPDVLALPLSEAIARLEAAGIQYTVTVFAASAASVLRISKAGSLLNM